MKSERVGGNWKIYPCIFQGINMSKLRKPIKI